MLCRVLSRRMFVRKITQSYLTGTRLLLGHGFPREGLSLPRSMPFFVDADLCRVRAVPSARCLDRILVTVDSCAPTMDRTN